MPSKSLPAADRILRARLREPLRFPDLSERRALKLAAVPQYTARAHFGLWHRRMGGPNFTELTGVFTPLYLVEIEATDVVLDPMQPVLVRGETALARVLDTGGQVDHIIRDGSYVVVTPDTEQIVAKAHLLNVFTRYDTDPVRRRVTALPPEMGLGKLPSRVRAMPHLDDVVPANRPPDFAETGTRIWHYGHTDPNRHVSGMEYVREMENYVAEVAHSNGHDMRRLFFSRARIIYRKPCFRGEGYRRAAWMKTPEPLTMTGVFFKANDPPGSRPAVVVELTLSANATAAG